MISLASIVRGVADEDLLAFGLWLVHFEEKLGNVVDMIDLTGASPGKGIDHESLRVDQLVDGCSAILIRKTILDA